MIDSRWFLPTSVLLLCLLKPLSGNAQETSADHLGSVPLPRWLEAEIAGTGSEVAAFTLRPAICPAVKGLLGGYVPEPKTLVHGLVLPDRHQYFSFNYMW